MVGTDAGAAIDATPEGHAAWTNWLQIGSLRPYQGHAVEQLQSRLGQAGARACLVAPPGAGKTYCALQLAWRLRLAVEIRVPTTALVTQWQTAIERDFEVIGASEPLPVNVATYASLADDADSDPFPSGCLVVLDEAHHLTARWGEQIQARLHAGQRVLGLTATPPFEHRGLAQFFDLVGSDPVVVDLPPLVRGGHLSPYQELVWPVLAEADEVAELQAFDRELLRLQRGLGNPLRDWIARQLDEDLDRLTETRFSGRGGLLVALCRLHREFGGHLPLDLPPDAEFSQRPTLDDRAQVLWAWSQIETAHREQVLNLLGQAGYSRRGGSLVLTSDAAHACLVRCRARLRAALDIVHHEQLLRQHWLRALILTDRDHEGDRLSAREVLKALVADPHGDRTDPILITGSALWIDDDLWPRLEHKLPKLPWRVVGDHHEVDISRWPTGERVALITEFLSRGLTRCLVGTYHLLGEGWDCPAVNCLIDLTGVAASISTNQIRGRALRNDPNDPGKVASLWEVVTVAPGIGGGERMLTRLQARHEHTLGLDRRGAIRTGVSRIDPRLLLTPERLAAQASDLQAGMIERAGEWAQVRERWAVGHSYRDRRLWCAQVPSTTPTRVRRLPPPRQPLRGASQALRVRIHQRQQNQRWLGVGSASVITTGVLAVAGTPGAIAMLAALAPWLALGAADYILRRQERQQLPMQLRHLALTALHQTLQEMGLIDGDLQIDEAMVWLDGEPEPSRLFAESAAELLGPVRYPRYLLLEPDGRVWPVPTVCARQRSQADALAMNWARLVGPCSLLFARNDEGRALLRQCWRNTRADHDTIELVERWD